MCKELGYKSGARALPAAAHNLIISTVRCLIVFLHTNRARARECSGLLHLLTSLRYTGCTELWCGAERVHKRHDGDIAQHTEQRHKVPGADGRVAHLILKARAEKEGHWELGEQETRVADHAEVGYCSPLKFRPVQSN
jgi:hypothetical protein